VETARPAAWYALTAVADGDPDAALASSAAKAAANAAATTASYHTLQVHGGIGFTWEHDLHLWLKRGKALEGAYGSLRHHHRALGDAVVTSADLMETFGPALRTAS
jgi:alkylation response protein AidB-like acyl-CoA dehydrogenase